MLEKMQWPENSFTPREMFSCMYGSSTMLQTLPEGTTIDVKKFAVYDDEKENGDCVEVLHIVDTNDHHYSTISNSIKKLMIGFAEIVPDAKEGFSIKTRHGKTKANRDFLTVDIF